MLVLSVIEATTVFSIEFRTRRGKLQSEHVIFLARHYRYSYHGLQMCVRKWCGGFAVVLKMKNEEKWRSYPMEAMHLGLPERLLKPKLPVTCF